MTNVVDQPGWSRRGPTRDQSLQDIRPPVVHSLAAPRSCRRTL